MFEKGNDDEHIDSKLYTCDNPISVVAATATGIFVVATHGLGTVLVAGAAVAGVNTVEKSLATAKWHSIDDKYLPYVEKFSIKENQKWRNNINMMKQRHQALNDESEEIRATVDSAKAPRLAPGDRFSQNMETRTWEDKDGNTVTQDFFDAVSE